MSCALLDTGSEVGFEQRRTLRTPNSFKRTFEGLRSQYKMPLECTYCRPLIKSTPNT